MPRLLEGILVPIFGTRICANRPKWVGDVEGLALERPVSRLVEGFRRRVSEIPAQLYSTGAKHMADRGDDFSVVFGHFADRLDELE